MEYRGVTIEVTDDGAFRAKSPSGGNTIKTNTMKSMREKLDAALNIAKFEPWKAIMIGFDGQPYVVEVVGIVSGMWRCKSRLGHLRNEHRVVPYSDEAMAMAQALYERRVAEEAEAKGKMEARREAVNALPWKAVDTPTR